MKQVPAVNPKKRFGQNFLNNESVLARIENAVTKVLELHPQISQFVEIGPGTGQLTKILAQQQLPTTALEIDQEAYDFLKTQDFIQNIDLKLADALKLSLNGSSVFGRSYFLVANLPFNVGSRILVNMGLTNPINNPLLVILQKEVAQKTLLSSLEEHFTLFGAWMNLFWETRILFDISRSSYTPTPDVATSVLCGLPKSDIPEFYRTRENRQKALEMLKSLTVHPRKTVQANLKYAGLESSKIDNLFANNDWPSALRLNAKNYRDILQRIILH